MDVETLKLTEEVRVFVGVPIVPNSAHRCESHNRRVGGGSRSQHLYGRAIDLPVPNPKAAYDFLCEKYPDEFGFGYYTKDGFVHVDTRSNGPARWGS
jgi:uncharacterized protein YcbK (DUF882 family)